jgi:hypothetical protein
MKFLFSILLSLVAVVCLAQGPAQRIALLNLQKSKSVKGVKSGQFGLTDVNGNQKYAPYTTIAAAPIAFTPTPTGNTTHLSEFVTTALGALYYIDWQGRAQLFAGGGGATCDYDWLKISNNGCPLTINDSLYKYKYVAIGARYVWPLAQLLVSDSTNEAAAVIAGQRGGSLVIYNNITGKWTTLQLAGSGTNLFIDSTASLSIKYAAGGTAALPSSATTIMKMSAVDSTLQLNAFGATRRTDTAALNNIAYYDYIGRLRKRPISNLPALIPLNGDVTGTAQNNNVVGLQGNAIDPTLPDPGQALIWQAGLPTGSWVPGYYNPADLLQGGATTNQVLQWNGTFWNPGTVSGISGLTAGRIPYASSPTTLVNGPMITDGTRVGIGVTPSFNLLHILGNGNQFKLDNGSASLTIANSGNTIWDFEPFPALGTDNQLVRFFRHTSTTGTVGITLNPGNNSSTDAVRLGANGNSWFTPTNDGYVGIGTSTPQGKFSVTHAGSNFTANDRAVNILQSTTFNTTAGPLTSYACYIGTQPTRSSGSNPLTNVALYASADPTAQFNYAAIFNLGFVGVGTQTPLVKFHVEGTGAPGAVAASFMSGNVGIGTTSPTAALHIKAGLATAGMGQIKLDSSGELTVKEKGVVNYNGQSVSTTLNDSLRVTLPGVLFVDTDAAKSQGTTETNLYVRQIKGRTFNQIGSSVHSVVCGNLADATSVNARLRFYLGGTLIMDTGAAAVTAVSGWQAETWIENTGSNILQTCVKIFAPGLTGQIFVTNTTLTSLSLGNPLQFKITATATGAGASNDDITAQWQKATFYPTERP